MTLAKILKLPVNSKLYDRLKFLAQVLLPALGTFYFALAGIWGLPAADEVVATILALDTFLGVTLHLSSTVYNKGDNKYDGSVDVDDTDDKLSYSLNLNGDPEKLKDKKEIRFKVNPPK